MWFQLFQLDPDWQMQQTTWVLQSLSFQNHLPRGAHHSSPHSPALPVSKRTSLNVHTHHPDSLIFSSVPTICKDSKGVSSKLPQDPNLLVPFLLHLQSPTPSPRWFDFSVFKCSKERSRDQSWSPKFLTTPLSSLAPFHICLLANCETPDWLQVPGRWLICCRDGNV